MGKDFYHMFKTNFSEHNKFGGNKNDIGTSPECPTVSAGLHGQNRRQKVFHWGPHVCAGG